MAAKTGGKTGRPPFKNREQKIVSLRKYVAQEILDTGAIPNLRMLGDALGYAVSASSNIYASIDAMRKAAQEALDSYPDEQ